MSIPFTPEDFTAIGARFQSEDIITEIDRLLPLAAADIDLLKSRGYGQPELDHLTSYRDALVSEVAARKQQRNAKKGSRKVEADAIHEGKLVLRSGVVMAEAALMKRAPLPDEAAAQTKQIVTDLSAQIDALSGRVGSDSAKLRTRLTSLVSVLSLPTLAPHRR